MPQPYSTSSLGQIGNTPLVQLTSFSQPGSAQVWAKLENLNPGGSVKDRIARAMLEAAEQAGRLKPRATIVEPTNDIYD